MRSAIVRNNLNCNGVLRTNRRKPNVSKAIKIKINLQGYNCKFDSFFLVMQGGGLETVEPLELAHILHVITL